MSNPLYAHAYSSFRQQDREHRHPPAVRGSYSRQGWNGSVVDGGRQEDCGEGRDNWRGRSRLIPYSDCVTTYGDGTPTAASLQRQEAQRRRVRSVLLVAALSFVGLVVLDGLVRLTDFSSRVEERAAELERRLVYGGSTKQSKVRVRAP